MTLAGSTGAGIAASQSREDTHEALRNLVNRIRPRDCGRHDISAALHHAEQKDRQVMFEIPAAMKVEHDKLHADLSAATKMPGETGEAAKRVAAVLHDHFVSEEEFGLPPLALLGPIAEGHATPEMRKVIALTDRLKAEMPRMLSEHKAIVQALDELGRAAKAERHPEVSRLRRGTDDACADRGTGALPGCRPRRRESETEVPRYSVTV